MKTNTETATESITVAVVIQAPEDQEGLLSNEWAWALIADWG